MTPTRRIIALALLATFTLPIDAPADEGMWAFNNLPLKQLKEKYGFEPTSEWADHIRLAAVRFNSGGSGSFVSPDGLVMTNHHVGADTLQKISTPENNYYDNGFLARTRDEEIKAPDLELNVVVAVQDVTDRVNAAVKEGTPDAEADAARREAIAVIAKEATDANGLRNDVVKLYQGGQYHLYTYKIYTDVRLVFAPEFDIAFFGGDPDNFEFPRYCLDVCFFRAYEDGQPAKVEHYLTWSKQGTQEGDLIFVAGNPGRTSRLNTLSHLEYLRDTAIPLQLDLLEKKEQFLNEYSRRGAEQARQAKEDLFSIQNSLKARRGGLQGLRDEDFMRRKAANEEALRSRIAGDADRSKLYGAAWEKIAEAEKAAADLLRPYNFLERGLGFDSEQFQIARALVRMAQEDARPNASRLQEYQEAARRSLVLALFSEAPIYPEYEKAKLAHSLAYWQQLDPDSPMVERVLRGRSPEEVASELVDGSKLADVSIRKAIAEGGIPAIEQSSDPMIKLALALDEESRRLRKQREEQVEGVESSNYALIARAMFEEFGDSVYPDATFTLRLAFGTVKGYEESGQPVPPYTQFAGLFERAAEHENQEPYRIPESWTKAKEDGRLNLDAPFNFVSTADIIGGNSGSPVVDRQGELVGIIFDGNIHSLVLDFGYEDRLARAISVDSRGIVEALRSVYQAEALLSELLSEGR